MKCILRGDILEDSRKMLQILFYIEPQATVVIKDNEETKVSYFQVAIFRVTENASINGSAMSYTLLFFIRIP